VGAAERIAQGKRKKVKGKRKNPSSLLPFTFFLLPSFVAVCRRARVDDKVPFQQNRTP
jgi:hypothetical protein